MKAKVIYIYRYIDDVKLLMEIVNNRCSVGRCTDLVGVVAVLPLPRVEQVPMEELARREVPAMALAMGLGVLAMALERLLVVRVSVMALVVEVRVVELVPPTRK